MSVAAHIDELRKKHEALARKVEAEERSPGSDDLHVRQLKRQKLKLKEEISRLSADA